MNRLQNKALMHEDMVPFMELLHEFYPGDHATSIREVRETERRLESGFDAAVILLDDIVQVSEATNLDPIPPAIIELERRSEPLCGRACC